jgi:esterase
MGSEAATWQRYTFTHDGLNFSYLDTGGEGRVLIALHAHWMEAITFSRFAAGLASGWRVVALDQRGHGYSDHAKSYTREDYLRDLEALLNHLLTGPVVLLGNSLGGVNAYQFAARHPNQVRGMIIEDIGAEVGDDMSLVLAWEGNFKTREELAERIGPRLSPYLEPSFRHTDRGWTLPFDPSDMMKSQASVNGNHWEDWLGSSCPALLIRGKESRVTKQAHMEEMAARRPNTDLRVMEGGHVIHESHPAAFIEVVNEFLRKL